MLHTEIPEFVAPNNDDRASNTEEGLRWENAKDFVFGWIKCTHTLLNRRRIEIENHFTARATVTVPSWEESSKGNGYKFLVANVMVIF